MAHRLLGRLRGFGCAGRLYWFLEVDEGHDGSGARCARVLNDPIASARSRSWQTDCGRPAGQHLQRTHGCLGAIHDVRGIRRIQRLHSRRLQDRENAYRDWTLFLISRSKNSLRGFTAIPTS